MVDQTRGEAVDGAGDGAGIRGFGNGRQDNGDIITIWNPRWRASPFSNHLLAFNFGSNPP